MKQHILLVITLVVSSAFAQAAEIEQSVRFYTKGSLVNAKTLPFEGHGFLKIFRPKNRNYGTFELLTMVQTVAQEIAHAHPKRDRMQIGDIANLKGGSIGQHKSHQNGLDIDIVYYRKNNREQDPNAMGRYMEKFVSKGKLSANFDMERNWQALTKFASHPQVERIFVDLAIKKTYCNIYAKHTDPLVQQTLRVMRPAALHDDHFHMRITCPPGSKRCVAQGPTPEGNGCAPRQLEMDFLNMEDEFGC